jgi:hypothetical protein
MLEEPHILSKKLCLALPLGSCSTARIQNDCLQCKISEIEKNANAKNVCQNRAGLFVYQTNYPLGMCFSRTVRRLASSYGSAFTGKDQNLGKKFEFCIVIMRRLT